MNINLEQKSTALHGIIGVAAGILSGFLAKDPYQIPNSQILLFAIGVLAILYFVSQKIFKFADISTEQKKYNFKWYASNGIYPYLIIWLVAWIFIYNI